MYGTKNMIYFKVNFFTADKRREQSEAWTRQEESQIRVASTSTAGIKTSPPQQKK